MLRIQKLVLHKFPHVAPGTTLEFGPGLNVLLGKNGTGKTTLLKLLTRVAALDFEGLEEEGDYKLECVVDYGSVSLELLVESEWVAVPKSRRGGQDQALELRLGRRVQHWRYEGILFDEKRNIITRFSNGSHSVWATSPSVKAREGSNLPGLNGRMATDIWLYFWMSDPLDAKMKRKAAAASDALYTIHLATVRALAGRFDEALLAYEAFCGTAAPLDSRTPQPAQLRGIATKGGGFFTRTFMPEDAFQGIEREEFAASLGSHSADLAEIAPLANFLDTAGLLGATIEIDKPEQSGADEFTVRTYTNFKLRVTLDPQTTVYSNRLSFGQKRLFAFYWYLACIPEGVVLADELVNGFHHDWIAACLDQIGDRQAILASQNPLLLDFLTFDDAEQVRRSFVLCSLEDKEDGGRQWNWHNMSAERAGEFFRAYEVGLQHVSEILRVGGWW